MKLDKTLATIILAILSGCAESKNSPTHFGQTSSQQTQYIPKQKTLNFITKEGLMYNLELTCYENGVLINNSTTQTQSPLRFYEAGPLNNYKNVELGDSFVLTNETNQNTRILRFSLIDFFTNEVVFEDLALGTIRAKYDVITRLGRINAGKFFYDFRLDNLLQNMAVDQNGDKNWDGAPTKIITQNGIIIKEQDLTH